MDMTHICPSCSTDTREGSHQKAKLSEDGNSITFTCIVPRHSDLPRAIAFLEWGDRAPEYWYRNANLDAGPVTKGQDF